MVIYLQVTADLFLCIVGSVEALHVVFCGGANLGSYAFDFFVPVVLSNTVGVVVFVAS